MSRNLLRTPITSSSSSSSDDPEAVVVDTPIQEDPEESTFLVTNTDGKSRHTRFQDEENSSRSRNPEFSMSEERLDAIIKRAIEKAKDDWIHAHETGMADNLHINDPPLRDIDRDHGSRASVSSGSAAPRPSKPEQLLTNSGSCETFNNHSSCHRQSRLTCLIHARVQREDVVSLLGLICG